MTVHLHDGHKPFPALCRDKPISNKTKQKKKEGRTCLQLDPETEG
jgi:hypothetical protein